MPGVVQHTVGSARRRGQTPRRARDPRRRALRCPRAQRRRRLGSVAIPTGSVSWRSRARCVESVGDEHSVLITDLCLDEYTDHGHCGVLNGEGAVDNDATLARYGAIALAQAAAGADLVAPSGMMDGQVAAIRSALDGAGHASVGILAYAAKYASAFYGPFRDAVGVEIAGGGDRRAYQQDPANAREAPSLEVAPRSRRGRRPRDGEARGFRTSTSSAGYHR